MNTSTAYCPEGPPYRLQYDVVAQDSHLYGPLFDSLRTPSPGARLQQLDHNLEGKLVEKRHEPMGQDVAAMDSRSQSYDFTVL